MERCGETIRSSPSLTSTLKRSASLLFPACLREESRCEETRPTGFERVTFDFVDRPSGSATATPPSGVDHLGVGEDVDEGGFAGREGAVEGRAEVGGLLDQLGVAAEGLGDLVVAGLGLSLAAIE